MATAEVVSATPALSEEKTEESVKAEETPVEEVAAAPPTPEPVAEEPKEAETAAVPEESAAPEAEAPADQDETKEVVEQVEVETKEVVEKTDQAVVEEPAVEKTEEVQRRLLIRKQTAQLWRKPKKLQNQLRNQHQNQNQHLQMKLQKKKVLLQKKKRNQLKLK
ncbi:hypothetical protein CK203_073554 [Vitis vinifera]|uniref:Uncharacterized protein n=1 Tax=Vitis vinifera TaxID=29760 RepID=A0A438DTM8_VITVI|nr:hypothetical protein CK203_073554 [Vitis vinifera]